MRSTRLSFTRLDEITVAQYYQISSCKPRLINFLTGAIGIYSKLSLRFSKDLYFYCFRFYNGEDKSNTGNFCQNNTIRINQTFLVFQTVKS